MKKKLSDPGLVVQPRRMGERHTLRNEVSHGYFALDQPACWWVNRLFMQLNTFRQKFIFCSWQDIYWSTKRCTKSDNSFILVVLISYELDKRLAVSFKYHDARFMLAQFNFLVSYHVQNHCHLAITSYVITEHSPLWSTRCKTRSEKP